MSIQDSTAGGGADQRLRTRFMWSRPDVSIGWSWFLLTAAAVLATLVVVAPASAVIVTSTYDTNSCDYDASSLLSTAHVVAGASPGSPAGAGAGSWVSDVSIGRIGVAAETGAATAGDGVGLLSRIGSRLCSFNWADDTGAIGRGTPRTNIAQNKQFNDAIKDGERQLGRTLSKDERSAVHREISGQYYGYHDIVNEVLGMFGGGQ